jgi:hypothetical protein
MAYEYSEDNLLEHTAIYLFFNQLGWDTQLAYNIRSFGQGIGLCMRNLTCKQGKKTGEELVNL